MSARLVRRLETTENTRQHCIHLQTSPKKRQAREKKAAQSEIVILYVDDA